MFVVLSGPQVLYAYVSSSANGLVCPAKVCLRIGICNWRGPKVKVDLTLTLASLVVQLERVPYHAMTDQAS